MYQPSSSTQLGITFAVDNVTETQGRIPESPVSEHLTKRFGSAPLAISCEPDRLIVATRAPSFRFGIHPLMEAIHLAFAKHLPLVLSPDAIWMVIAQGFGHHVGEHAESLRPRFVRHQGKAVLEVKVTGRPDSADTWREAVKLLSRRIAQETDPVIHETLVADFSTTTEDIRTASEIVLLDTFAHYFEYLVMCICGIPEITLEGTPADWQRIRDRVEVLATFDLDGWVERLRPILDQFVRTSEGQPDIAFWQAIYKPKEAYGATEVTGWIGDLFPYLGDPPRRRPNYLLEQQRINWTVPVMHAPPLEAFPSGVSRVPVKLNDQGRKQRIELAGGFLGIDRRYGDSALSPLIGWAVLSGNRIDSGWEELEQQFSSVPARPDAEPPSPDCRAELQGFAARFASMDLNFPDRRWRIVPGASDLAQGNFSKITFAYDDGVLDGRASGQFLAVAGEGRFPGVSIVYLLDGVRSPDGPSKYTLSNPRKIDGDFFEALRTLVRQEGKLS